MLGQMGIPEFVVLLIAGTFLLAMLLAGVWALLTLYRLRAAQEQMRERLETIERLLERRSG